MSVTQQCCVVTEHTCDVCGIRTLCGYEPNWGSSSDCPYICSSAGSHKHRSYALQAKSPIVEELQDHMMGFQQHRGQIAAENSAGNDREEMAPAEAAVQAALGVLSRCVETCYHPQLLFKSISLA